VDAERDRATRRTRGDPPIPVNSGQPFWRSSKVREGAKYRRSPPYVACAWVLPQLPLQAQFGEIREITREQQNVISGGNYFVTSVRPRVGGREDFLRSA
jgi:hypothetical protein